MTLATTNVALSAIQTEFGGANPVSLSEYYKSGLYVPSIQTTSGTDGTAIPTSGTIRIGMFRGLTKSVSGGITSAWYNGYNEADRTASGTVSVSVQFLSTGAIQTTVTGALGSTQGSNGVLWYNPATTGIGSSYWIRATLQSGTGPYAGGTSITPTTGTMGAWTSLGTTQIWANSVTGSLNAQATKYSLIKFEISTNSSGTNIVASGNIGIEATKDTGA